MACPANTVLAALIPRHSAMNDVIKRALEKAGLPSVLEPPGLDRGDGSRLDGITVFPFNGGMSLVWDCTCVDTFTGVHLFRSAMEAGTAANSAVSANAVNTLLLQRHISLSQLQSKRWECMVSPQESS